MSRHEGITSTLTIRMSDALKDALTEASERNDVRVSVLVRNILEHTDLGSVVLQPPLVLPEQMTRGELKAIVADLMDELKTDNV